MMSNPPIPPIVPRGDDDRSGDLVDDELTRFDDREDEPLDPDLDADQISSAEADVQASTEGEKDSGLER